MNHEIYEKLNNRETMLDAEKELIDLGASSIVYLESILSGKAKNRFGVPYNKLGLPVTCTLEIIARMGDTAKELENYVAKEILDRDPSALRAISSFSSINEESIASLASSLSTESLFAHEAALVLKKFGALNHPMVLAIAAKSEYAQNVINKV